jgi:release factor glutamine methyltransferase
MSASPLSSPAPLPPAADVVTRLREAGCVFAEDEARLIAAAARTPAELAALVDRRAAGEPLEHVLGWAEFCGRRFAVDPGVFVPRRRTEFLMWQAAARAREVAGATPGGRPVVVLDLCCGSGALGAALAAVLDQAELHAADVDPAAVRCARRNVAAAGGRVYQGDLFEPLPAALRGRVDILLANVPYVPTGDIGLLPAEARLHEARLALDGGPDGLDVLRRVAEDAASWLAPGGQLLTETSGRQAPQAAAIVAGHGLGAQVIESAEWNSAVVTGTR